MSAEKTKPRYPFRLAFLHPRYWPTWLGLGVFFLMSLLPVRVLDFFGVRLGRFAAGKNRKRFHIVKTNLSLCFPDKNGSEIERMALQAFEAQFRSLLHYCGFFWWPEARLRRHIHKQGFEQIEQYRDEGKNIIVLLSHHVGLDFGGMAVSMDYYASSVYKVLRNPVMNWVMANGRLRFARRRGGELFVREDGLRPLIRATRRGAVLIYLADEDLGEQHSVFAPFFGVPRATLPVLGRLAQSCKAVVLPCVSCYNEEKRRYDVTLMAPVEDLSATDDEHDAAALNRATEQCVLACPVQYLWTLRYFQTRPPGEASVYE